MSSAEFPVHDGDYWPEGVVSSLAVSHPQERLYAWRVPKEVREADRTGHDVPSDMQSQVAELKPNIRLEFTCENPVQESTSPRRTNRVQLDWYNKNDTHKLSNGASSSLKSHRNAPGTRSKDNLQYRQAPLQPQMQQQQRQQQDTSLPVYKDTTPSFLLDSKTQALLYNSFPRLRARRDQREQEAQERAEALARDQELARLGGEYNDLIRKYVGSGEDTLQRNSQPQPLSHSPRKPQSPRRGTTELPNAEESRSSLNPLSAPGLRLTEKAIRLTEQVYGAAGPRRCTPVHPSDLTLAHAEIEHISSSSATTTAQLRDLVAAERRRHAKVIQRQKQERDDERYQRRIERTLRKQQQELLKFQLQQIDPNEGYGTYREFAAQEAQVEAAAATRNPRSKFMTKSYEKPIAPIDPKSKIIAASTVVTVRQSDLDMVQELEAELFK